MVLILDDQLLVESFLMKFEPLERWCTGQFTRGRGKNAAHCALGHCGFNDNLKVTQEGKTLSSLFARHDLDITKLNDGVGDYASLGDTPKERVINALVLISLEESL